ncbi:hypothetical protein PIROE2DRAFT_32130, partial [Piromyces sp. E2]
NRDVTLATMFYFGNTLHDIFYNLGFDEKHGNHQQNNFGKGGKGNDALIMEYYEGICSDTTSTPLDGFPAVIGFPSFYNENGEKLNSGISSHVAIHEYGHAVTGRLVGGPNFDCYIFGNNTESDSLGEGYSDFFSEALQYSRKNNVNRDTYFQLDHIYNPYNVISSQQKEYTYSKLNEIRADKYGYLTGATVWRLMLHEVFWNIIDNYPDNISDDYLKVYNSEEVIPTNILLLKLIIKSLSLQGCNPTFIKARNSLINAMEKDPRTAWNNEFKCLVWKGFASRGLGFNAA